MKWLIIARRKKRRPTGGQKVELPGVIVGDLEAPDADTARRVAQSQIPDKVDVISDASWRLMSSAERDRLLGNCTPPEHVGTA